LASLLILSFPFVFHLILHENKKWKAAAISCMCLIIISLALIQSKNAFIAFSIFGISCFVLLKSFKVIKYFLFGFGLVFIIYLTNEPLKNNFIKDYKKIESLINKVDALQNFERVRLYRNSIKMFIDSPIIGVGPGNWKIYFPSYGLKNSIGEKGVKFALRPHSDFLLYFSEGGIIAGVLFILLFYLIIKKSRMIINTSVGSEKVFFCIYLSTILSYVWLTAFDFPNEKPLHLFLFAILTAYLIHENKGSTSQKKTNYLFSGSLIIISFFSMYISYMNYNGSKYISSIINNRINRNWSQLVINADKSLKFGNIFDHTGTPLYWYTGLSYFNQNKIIKAKENFLKSYKIHPNHIHVLNNLAVSISKSNSTKSLELLEKCNNISPRFEECSINLSKIYNSKKNYEKSLDCLLKTINTNNDTENDFSTQFYEQSLHTLNFLYLSYYGRSFGYEFDKKELFSYLLYICEQRKFNKPFKQSL
jgi:tetratricopeptide (TPR) repeat protein